MAFEIIKLLDKNKHNGHEEEIRQFAQDVVDGLSENPKELPSKYFYDEEGSKIFQEITDLKEYYPTGCEFEILDNQKGFLGNLFQGNPFSLVDLGAGDARKTKILLRDFVKRGIDFTYIPVDISHSQMEELKDSLEEEFGNNLRFRGLSSQYEPALHWMIHNAKGPKLVLSLGGNTGNYHPRETRRNLRGLQMRLNDRDYLFAGFDLKKDRKVLQAAYDDSKGVTKRFNLNLLARINRELGADFDLDSFDHHSYYDEEKDAMVSWLVNNGDREVTVNIPYTGSRFSFRPYESIHTEFSYKFERGSKPPTSHNKQGQIGWLANRTGYQLKGEFVDSRSYFMDALFQVNKPKERLKS